MKSNLQFIFDKITAEQETELDWRGQPRQALMERALAIGLSDRGADIGSQAAAQLADALLAAREADRATLLRIRRSLLLPPEG